MAEWSRDRGDLVLKASNIYCLDLYGRSLPTPDLASCPSCYSAGLRGPVGSAWNPTSPSLPLPFSQRSRLVPWPRPGNRLLQSLRMSADRVLVLVS